MKSKKQCYNLFLDALGDTVLEYVGNKKISVSDFLNSLDTNYFPYLHLFEAYEGENLNSSSILFDFKDNLLFEFESGCESGKCSVDNSKLVKKLLDENKTFLDDSKKDKIQSNACFKAYNFYENNCFDLLKEHLKQHKDSNFALAPVHGEEEDERLALNYHNKFPEKETNQHICALIHSKDEKRIKEYWKILNKYFYPLFGEKIPSLKKIKVELEKIDGRDEER